MRLFCVASLVAISTLTFGASANAQELPNGPGKAVVQTACSQCHSLDVVISQSRSRESWTDVVSQMVGNGAQLSDDDYNLVIEYLAAHFGPAGQSASETNHATATAPAGKSRN